MFLKTHISIILIILIGLLSYSFCIGQPNSIKSYTYTFKYYAPNAKDVSVIGTFNNWDKEKDNMIRKNPGYWEKEITIQRGFQKYAFVVDDVLVKDPLNSDIVRIKYEGSNYWGSFLFIPLHDEIIFPEELDDDLKKIKFKFFNSPRFYFYKKFPDKVMEFDQYPELYVEFDVTKDFSNIKFAFTIYNEQNEPLITRSRMSMSWNKLYDMHFRCFDKQLVNPAYIIFKLKTDDKEYSVKRDLKTHRFYGRVTDFDGNPIDSAYVYAEGMFSWCDKNGNFDMKLLPGIYRRNWASDVAYRDTHLENYFIDLILDKDTELNFKIGELEIYQLNVAPVSETDIIQGQFIVWSISSVRDFKSPDDKPKHTPIRSSEVSIYLNGEEANLKILTPIIRLGDDRKTEWDGWYFEALAPRSAKKLKKNELKVVIAHHTTDENGNPIIEKGQAQFLNLLWP